MKKIIDFLFPKCTKYKHYNIVAINKRVFILWYLLHKR